MALSSIALSKDFFINFADLCRSARMSSDYLIELINYNIVKPITGRTPGDWKFSSNAVKIINKAVRLHQDLEIEWTDIALVVDLLDEINQLENENRQLKNQVHRLLSFKL